ncbi:MAG: SGNH/GDSL hydrolase family protein [Pleurocapsa sp. MO_192.B19]|nr:SGNH/GDSL hydrolase family protein [Pleurocapsa sp. MO_192.B19]
MKILLRILASLVGVTVAAELGLRLIMGLGNPPLYIADEEIGYLLAPNQKLRYSGNLVEINQYSLRNQEIKREKEDNTQRILLLGDSIVNGSWWTDQTETLSALVAKQLKKTSGNKSSEVLNASANSWGPRNELAYIKRFGLFDADALVLVINTDDLFATEPTSLVVGQSYHYPDRAPLLALIELYQVYFAPTQSIPELENLQKAETDSVGANLAAILEIKAIAQESNTKFILAMTPLLREFEKGSTPRLDMPRKPSPSDLLGNRHPSRSKEEEIQARERLQEFIAAENIEYIDFLNVWADFPQPEFLYRDRIHPSPQGNTKIAETITKSLTSK